jgi:hypothetical protein
MDVGLWNLGFAARTDRADDIAFADRRSLRDRRGSEMRQRDDVAVRRRDRDDDTARRHRADERDPSAGDGAHRSAGLSSDVDAAVLAGGIRVRAEAERSQHLAARRPGPRTGHRRQQQRDREDGRDG